MASTTPTPTPRAFAGRHEPQPLPFDPAKLRGLSERLLRSHWENNYCGALKALNAIEQRLSAMIDDPDAPGWVVLAMTSAGELHNHWPWDALLLGVASRDVHAHRRHGERGGARCRRGQDVREGEGDRRRQGREAGRRHRSVPFISRPVEDRRRARPPVLFLHYWGVGPAEDLARGLRAALDRTATRLGAR
ncbi:MAG: DUF1259 domain-containing protein [Anaeromyxobacteraceae bacterium]